jgi:hypothetical protein
MAKKYSKNLQKVQEMVDGTFGGHKIQSGFIPENVHEGRKIGDKWTDSDGVEWEQKDGYHSKISKIVHGLGDNCKKCEKLIIKSFDKDTYNRMGKCYHCQMHFEEDMKFSRIGNGGNKWVFWVRSQQLHQMDSIEKAMEEYINEMHKGKNLEDNPFDMSVVNAIANSGIDATIQRNKRSTD